MKAIKYNDKTYVIPKPFNQCYFGSERVPYTSTRTTIINKNTS